MSSAVPTVIQVNISPGGIPKRPIPVGTITFAGVEGDGHNHEKHNSPLQALSMLDVEHLDDLRAEGFDVYPGATGENLSVAGLRCESLSIGDRLIFSGGVIAEITKHRKPCFVLDAIDPRLKVAIHGRTGCYAKVIQPGTIRPGETIDVLPAAVAVSAEG